MNKKTKETLEFLLNESKGNEKSQKAFFAFLKSSGLYKEFIEYLAKKEETLGNKDNIKKETVYALIDENAEITIGKAVYQQILPESKEQSVVLDCGIGFISPLGDDDVLEAVTLDNKNINVGFGEYTSDALMALAIEIKKNK